MLIALPNKDKSWTCTLFMPMDKFPLILESEKEEILGFFNEHFKDFMDLIEPEHLVNQVRNGKARTLISVKVSNNFFASVRIFSFRITCYRCRK